MNDANRPLVGLTMGDPAGIGPEVIVKGHRESVAHAKIDAIGPESPDTVYVQAAAGAYDCVVSMYHGQGHIPIEMLGFSGGAAISDVNVTIGLPIVRTSVDHGSASETSLVEAVEVAAEMAEVQR